MLNWMPGLPSVSDGDLSEIAIEDLDISEEELGRGAFGCVFRAQYPTTHIEFTPHECA